MLNQKTNNIVHLNFFLENLNFFKKLKLYPKTLPFFVKNINNKNIFILLNFFFKVNNFLIIKSKVAHPSNLAMLNNYYFINNYFYYFFKSNLIYSNIFNIINIIYDYFLKNNHIYFYSSKYIKPYLHILNSNLFSYFFCQNHHIYLNFNSSWLRNKKFKFNFKYFLKSKKYELIFLYDLDYFRLNHFFFKSLNKPLIGFQSIKLSNDIYTYSIICNINNVINYYLFFLTINKIYLLSLLNKQKILIFYFYNYYLKFLKFYN